MKIILVRWMFAFLFLSISGSLFQIVYADPPLPTPVGRVVWVRGELKAIMENQEQRILQKTSLIYLKDTLLTGRETQAQIVFTDESSITFRPDTKFIVSQYQFHPKSKGSVGKYIMDLIQGGFRTITGAVAKNNSSDYQINTPVATIGVRGTDFTIFYDKKGGLYVGQYKGSPCITNKKGELCLDNKTPFVRVPDAITPPQPLSKAPDVFQEKLEITPAKIADSFGFGNRATGGTVSSFCIQ